MSTGVSIQVLGQLRGGVFTPAASQECSCFDAERIAVGSRSWSVPGIVLADSTVSPRHAVISQEGGRWVVRDLESDNGICAIEATGSGWTPGRAAAALEFEEELHCCVGAVVLRLRATRG
ncbi:MAG: FHA domain-containing protein [Gemmataceae bacterium]|nr:FHA domain-containing protein [Gemmataceae bacterium]